MKYSDLKLVKNSQCNIIEIGDNKIQVLQYLPIKDKIDLIELTLQNSEENGTYNEVKLEMYFNLFLVYMYTNLEFTEEEKANPEEIYDILESNGVISDIVAAIDDTEYNILIGFLEDMKLEYFEHNNSAAGMIRSFIQDLPKNAEAAKDIVDNFDKDKYKEVVEFAQYANGNRPI